MDDSMKAMIAKVRQSGFFEKIFQNCGPMIAIEEEWGMPECGSIEWMLMRQVKLVSHGYRKKETKSQ